MSDTAYPVYQHYGTNAQRLAFTPAPAAGTQPIYIWYETDTDNYYIYTTAWKGPFASGGGGTVSTTGSPASGNLTKFSGALTVTNGDLSGDVTTSGTLATTIANNAVTTAKITNSAVTLAKIANAAANSVLIGSGAAGSGSAYAELTLGTGLSMSGTTLNASASGGGLVLLEQHTASSSASLVFTSWYSSSYDNYKVEFVSLLPATNDTELELNWSSDGGSTWDTSAIYSLGFIYQPIGATGTSGSATGGTWASLAANVSNAATGGINGSFELYDPGSTSAYKTSIGLSTFKHSTLGQIMFWRMFLYANASAVNAFRLQMNSGNIASGTCRIYGIAK
jgi:hypothetical protein